MQTVNPFATVLKSSVAFPIRIMYDGIRQVAATVRMALLDSGPAGGRIEYEARMLTSAIGDEAHSLISSQPPVEAYLNWALAMEGRDGAMRPPQMRVLPKQLYRCSKCGPIRMTPRHLRYLAGKFPAINCPTCKEQVIGEYKLTEVGPASEVKGETLTAALEQVKGQYPRVFKTREGMFSVGGLHMKVAEFEEVDPRTTGEEVDAFEEIYARAYNPESAVRDLPRMFAAVKDGSSPVWNSTPFEGELKVALQTATGGAMELCPLELAEKAGVAVHSRLLSLPEVCGWAKKEDLSATGISIPCWR